MPTREGHVPAYRLQVAAVTLLMAGYAALGVWLHLAFGTHVGYSHAGYIACRKLLRASRSLVPCITRPSSADRSPLEDCI